MSRKNITENEIIDRMKRLYGVTDDRDLAQLFKIAPHTISGWRKRGRVPHEYIERVKQEKDVSFDYLYSGDEPTGVKEAVSQYKASAGKEITTHDFANNVSRLSPHQALVARFQQADLAERIDRILVDIEAMDPDQLREIEAILESKRRYLESRLARDKTGKVSRVARDPDSGAAPKTAAGGE